MKVNGVEILCGGFYPPNAKVKAHLGMVVGLAGDRCIAHGASIAEYRDDLRVVDDECYQQITKQASARGANAVMIAETPLATRTTSEGLPVIYQVMRGTAFVLTYDKEE